MLAWAMLWACGAAAAFGTDAPPAGNTSPPDKQEERVVARWFTADEGESHFLAALTRPRFAQLALVGPDDKVLRVLGPRAKATTQKEVEELFPGKEVLDQTETTVFNFGDKLAAAVRRDMARTANQSQSGMLQSLLKSDATAIFGPVALPSAMPGGRSGPSVGAVAATRAVASPPPPKK